MWYGRSKVHIFNVLDIYETYHICPGALFTLLSPVDKMYPVIISQSEMIQEPDDAVNFLIIAML